MRLGCRLGQRRATTGRARASSGPRGTRRQSGGTDRQLTAERGVFGSSAEVDANGQLGLGSPHRKGAVLLRGNVPNFRIGSTAELTFSRQFSAANPSGGSRLGKEEI